MKEHVKCVPSPLGERVRVRGILVKFSQEAGSQNEKLAMGCRRKKTV